jgi:N-sulfoglucosamine sulfohydrolase
VIKPGTVDEHHLVSTLDFTPTLIEVAGAAPLPNLDGRSFLPALKGERMSGWDRVFTFYNQSSARNWLLMRCIRTKERAYIWNAWADGKMQYHAENMGGLTWAALVKAAETNPEIKRRVDFYLYRVPEEFYDLTGDPCERKNLIDQPERQPEIAALRAELLALLQRSGDPLAEAFAQRDRPEVLQRAKEKLVQDYGGKLESKAKTDGQRGKKKHK